MRWLFLGLLGCGSNPVDTADATQTSPVDFSAPGSYTPATASSVFTGQTGEELTIQYWYPSLDAGAGDPITYDGLAPGGAYEDLTADCPQSRPVLVFSHGYTGIRWQSAFFMEHLASHGYIVAAPDHAHNTFLDNDNSRFLEVVARRPLDIQDSFDWLVSQSALAEGPLAGCVDETQGYAVSGHSFGGFTTYATAGATFANPDAPSEDINLGDSRVWAALPLAPWDVDGLLSDGTADISVPVMTLSGGRDTTTGWAMVSRLHGALTATPRYLGEFPDAGHYSFAPIACMLYPTTNGCGDGFLDEETLMLLVNTSGMAFLESVRGDADAIDQLPLDSEALSWEIVD